MEALRVSSLLTYINTAVWVVIVLIVLVLLYQDAIPIEFVTSEICDPNGENCETNLDVINIAVQIGRLDFVSICLAILGGAIAMGALFGFISMKDHAEMVAKRTVRENWGRWEDEVLPKLTLKAIAKLMPIVADPLSDDSANDIAKSVGEEKQQ